LKTAKALGLTILSRSAAGFWGASRVAEGIIQWVTRHLTRFASRSIPNFASSSVGRQPPPMLVCFFHVSWTSALGVSALIERHLTDPRTGRNAQFPLRDLFRQSIHSRLAGYRTPTTRRQKQGCK